MFLLLKSKCAYSPLHFASHLLIWQVQDPAYWRATHKQHPLLFRHQGLDVTHRHTKKSRPWKWVTAKQKEQSGAGHSERSGRSLAQITVTTEHHNSPGLTHRELFWQTSFQQGRGGWLVGLREDVGREDGVDMRVCEQKRKLLLWVCVIVWMPAVWWGCNQISGSPVAEPNKDADVGQTVCPKVWTRTRYSWNLEQIRYAESWQEDNSLDSGDLLTFSSSLWTLSSLEDVFFWWISFQFFCFSNTNIHYN